MNHVYLTEFGSRTWRVNPQTQGRTAVLCRKNGTRYTILIENQHGTVLRLQYLAHLNVFVLKQPDKLRYRTVEYGLRNIPVCDVDRPPIKVQGEREEFLNYKQFKLKLLAFTDQYFTNQIMQQFYLCSPLGEKEDIYAA